MGGFPGYPKAAVDFFRGISKNNDKPWFESHKQRHINNCVRSTGELINEISGPLRKTDPQFVADPGRIVSWIYRLQVKSEYFHVGRRLIQEAAEGARTKSCLNGI